MYLHQSHHSNITAHYYYTVLYTLSICIIVKHRIPVELTAYFRGSFVDEVSVSDFSQLSVSFSQKQGVRAIQWVASTMTAPTIPTGTVLWFLLHRSKKQRTVPVGIVGAVILPPIGLVLLHASCFCRHVNAVKIRDGNPIYDGTPKMCK